MAKVSTRQSSSTKIQELVGAGKNFLSSEVPTNRAVIQQGILLKIQQISQHSTKYSNRDLCKDLVPLVFSQWVKANAQFVRPVTISEKALLKRILNLWETAEDYAWGRKTTGKDQFVSKLDKLMDISICRHVIILCKDKLSLCPNPSECEVKAHVSCDCPREKKIPIMELRWLHVQRSKVGELSTMQMGASDLKETRKQIKAIERKASRTEAQRKRIKIENEQGEMLQVFKFVFYFCLYKDK